MITKKAKKEAMQEYLDNPEMTIGVAAKNHGMSLETLRKFLGTKVRHKRGKKKILVAEEVTLFKKVTGRKPKQIVIAPNAHQRWPGVDDEVLKAGIDNNKTAKAMAKELGRSRRAILCRKHILIAQGFIKDPRRFKVSPFKKRTSKSDADQLALAFPKEQKMKRGPYKKTIVPIEVSVHPKVKEVKKVQKVTKSDGTQIQAIKLEDLAAIVNKHGVSVRILTNSEGTEITIKK